MNFMKRTLYFVVNLSIIFIFYVLIDMALVNIIYIYNGGIAYGWLNNGEFLTLSSSSIYSNNLSDLYSNLVFLPILVAVLLLVVHKLTNNEIDRKFIFSKKGVLLNFSSLLLLFSVSTIASVYPLPSEEERDIEIIESIKFKNMIPYPYDYEYINVVDSTILDEFNLLNEIGVDELTFKKITEIYRSETKQTSPKNCDSDTIHHQGPEISKFDTPSKYVMLSEKNIKRFLEFHEPSGCFRKIERKQITKEEIEKWCDDRIPRLYRNLRECKRVLREIGS